MTAAAKSNRDAFLDLSKADSAQGTDIMGAKQTCRARSRFAPIETLLNELERQEATNTAAA